MRSIAVTPGQGLWNEEEVLWPNAGKDGWIAPSHRLLIAEYCSGNPVGAADSIEIGRGGSLGRCPVMRSIRETPSPNLPPNREHMRDYLVCPCNLIN